MRRGGRSGQSEPTSGVGGGGEVSSGRGLLTRNAAAGDSRWQGVAGHSKNTMSCGISLKICPTGIWISSLLIVYDRLEIVLIIEPANFYGEKANSIPSAF